MSIKTMITKLKTKRAQRKVERSSGNLSPGKKGNELGDKSSSVKKEK